MKFIALVVLMIAGFVGTGCATVIEMSTPAALAQLNDNQRSDYRDALDTAATVYDGLYDRDGKPLEPAPEPEE